MEDEGPYGNDETRCFVLASLSTRRVGRTSGSTFLFRVQNALYARLVVVHALSSGCVPIFFKLLCLVIDKMSSCLIWRKAVMLRQRIGAFVVGSHSSIPSSLFTPVALHPSCSVDMRSHGSCLHLNADNQHPMRGVWTGPKDL